jgi:hypothetical protein
LKSWIRPCNLPPPPSVIWCGLESAFHMGVICQPSHITGVSSFNLRDIAFIFVTRSGGGGGGGGGGCVHQQFHQNHHFILKSLY